MDRQTELSVALHQGLSRLGPASAECTLKALALCEDLPGALTPRSLGPKHRAQPAATAVVLRGRHITPCSTTRGCTSRGLEAFNASRRERR